MHATKHNIPRVDRPLSRRNKWGGVQINIDAPPILLVIIASILIGVFAGLLTISMMHKFSTPPEPKKHVEIFIPVEDTALTTYDVVSAALEAKLKQFKRTWSDKTFSRVVNTIVIMERRTRIPHEDVVAIIATESEMKIIATGRNKDGSTDFGLSQQNSKHIKARYLTASKILAEEGIQFDISNKYDVALNVAACFVFLNDIKTELGTGARHADIIKSYNVGVRGVQLGRGEQYYNRFLTMKEAEF